LVCVCICGRRILAGGVVLLCVGNYGIFHSLLLFSLSCLGPSADGVDVVLVYLVCLFWCEPVGFGVCSELEGCFE